MAQSDFNPYYAPPGSRQPAGYDPSWSRSPYFSIAGEDPGPDPWQRNQIVQQQAAAARQQQPQAAAKPATQQSSDAMIGNPLYSLQQLGAAATGEQMVVNPQPGQQQISGKSGVYSGPQTPMVSSSVPKAPQGPWNQVPGLMGGKAPTVAPSVAWTPSTYGANPTPQAGGASLQSPQSWATPPPQAPGSSISAGTSSNWTTPTAISSGNTTWAGPQSMPPGDMGMHPSGLPMNANGHVDYHYATNFNQFPPAARPQNLGYSSGSVALATGAGAMPQHLARGGMVRQQPRQAPSAAGWGAPPPGMQGMLPGWGQTPAGAPPPTPMGGNFIPGAPGMLPPGGPRMPGGMTPPGMMPGMIGTPGIGGAVPPPNPMGGNFAPGSPGMLPPMLPGMIGTPGAGGAVPPPNPMGGNAAGIGAGMPGPVAGPIGQPLGMLPPAMPPGGMAGWGQAPPGMSNNLAGGMPMPPGGLPQGAPPLNPIGGNFTGLAGMLPPRRAQRRMTTGGQVSGQGSGDTVPAMLTPGEFVINKKAAQNFGIENLDRINAQHFQEGGPVQGATDYSYRSPDAMSYDWKQVYNRYAPQGIPRTIPYTPAQPGGHYTPEGYYVSPGDATAPGTSGYVYSGGPGTEGGKQPIGAGQAITPTTTQKVGMVAGAVGSGLMQLGQQVAHSVPSFQPMPSHIPDPSTFQRQSQYQPQFQREVVP